MSKVNNKNTKTMCIPLKTSENQRLTSEKNKGFLMFSGGVDVVRVLLLLTLKISNIELSIARG